jgi:hypothetical protein
MKNSICGKWYSPKFLWIIESEFIMSIGLIWDCTFMYFLVFHFLRSSRKTRKNITIILCKFCCSNWLIKMSQLHWMRWRDMARWWRNMSVSQNVRQLIFWGFFFCVTTECVWSSLFTIQTGDWIDTSSDP